MKSLPNQPNPWYPESMAMHGFADRIMLFGARTTLFLGLAIMASTMASGEDPSDRENSRVIACADHLNDQAVTFYPDNIPEDCGEYAYEYSSMNDPSGTANAVGMVTYTYPSKREFVSQNTVGESYDQQAYDDRNQTVSIFMSLSFVLYGIRGARYRLREVDAQRSFDDQQEASQDRIDREVEDFRQQIDRHDQRNRDK